MSIATDAIREADEVVASLVTTVVGLAQKSIRQRRREAAWRYVRASRRAAYAVTVPARRFWLWRARKWRAEMEANIAHPDLCCAIDEAMASLPRNGEART